MSGADPIRTTSDPRAHIPPFVTNVPGLGAHQMFHANFCLAGELPQPGGSAIILTIGVRGCQCGCDFPGRAFMLTPTEDELENLAHEMLALVTARRTAAADQAAAAAIDAAREKRP